MVHSLTYVSKSLIKFPDGDDEVQAIVDVALKRNLPLQVTGALISTAHYFAQILEGPRPAIDELMRSISRDPRHTDIRVLENSERARRQFSKWSLAYSGYARYVDRHISIFYEAPATFEAPSKLDPKKSMLRLQQLMLEFTR